MPTVRRAGQPAIAYTDTGGDRPAVVFSHGILMDQSMFDAQVAALAPAYRCISWDQRGHGATGMVTEEFSFWDSVDDLLAILDDAGVGSAVLIGMSQGGFVSLRVALRAPDRVRGLVFIDSQAGLEAEDAAPLYRAMAETWAQEGYDPAVAGFIATLILGEHADPEPWTAKWNAYPKEQVLQPTYTLLSRDDLTDRLGEVPHPALVIHGGADMAIPLERAETLAAGLPGCREPVVVVDGAGHAGNISHSEPYNRAILTFLTGLSPLRPTATI
jgi:pimeloyl-ACP methyl ester carboxylesterase